MVDTAMLRRLMRKCVYGNFPITAFLLSLGNTIWREAEEEQRRVADALQARIDELMLEHCPEEMTDEQKSAWARRSHSGVGSRCCLLSHSAWLRCFVQKGADDTSRGVHRRDRRCCRACRWGQETQMNDSEFRKPNSPIYQHRITT